MRACFTEGKFEEALSHYRNAWRVRPEDYKAVLLSMDALAIAEKLVLRVIAHIFAGGTTLAELPGSAHYLIELLYDLSLLVHE